MNGDRFPFWVFSSWGSDIYHFGRQREHESRVRQVLGSCDLFIADCQRDSKLASQFGFRGCHQEVFPGGGGFEISRMQPFRQGLPSRRRLIAVKGYHGGAWGGRALVALEALRLCADALRDYCIVVFSAHGNRQVCSLAEELSRTLRLEIILMPPSPREEIIKLMGRTRISLGLGITDGTPNAMLEAMIMGAFPIQSDTISTAEWIDHGRNGFLVPPEDPVVVAGAIRSAIVDDALVDRAAELNDGLTRDKVDVNIIKPQVIEMYRRVAKWKVRRDSSEQRGLCASW